MIATRTEDAIIERLRRGMGSMVRQIGSYGGELDDDLGIAIGNFPAAWVTFGGITKTEPTGTSRQKFKATGQFVVMVGDRNVRCEDAGRRGGAGPNEIGSYSLVYAVRRLLSGQDLDLPIDPLLPGRVRTLFNTRARDGAFSVFACEFQTAWIEAALPHGHWPSPTYPAEPGQPTDPTDPNGPSTPVDPSCPGSTTDADVLFAIYGGELATPAPAWLRTGLNYHLTPDDGIADARDIIPTRSKP